MIFLLHLRQARYSDAAKDILPKATTCLIIWQRHLPPQFVAGDGQSNSPRKENYWSSMAPVEDTTKVCPPCYRSVQDAPVLSTWTGPWTSTFGPLQAGSVTIQLEDRLIVLNKSQWTQRGGWGWLRRAWVKATKLKTGQTDKHDYWTAINPKQSKKVLYY